MSIVKALLTLSLAGSIAHAAAATDVESGHRAFLTQLRQHFDHRFSGRTERDSKLTDFVFTADLPADDDRTVERIKASPNAFLQFGYALLHQDVVCRVGLGLGYAGRFAMYDPPVQAVAAYCLRIDPNHLNVHDLGGSYDRQFHELAARDFSPEEVARAFGVTFRDYTILKISIEHSQVRVAQTKLFLRGSDPVDYHNAYAFTVDQVGNVDVSIRPRALPVAPPQLRHMGYRIPVPNCEAYFAPTEPRRTQVETTPMVGPA